MKPATRPRDRSEQQLLVIGRSGHEIARFSELPRFLVSGDLLVVNDAATLPASFRVNFPSGRSGELRLAGPSPTQAESIDSGRVWQAVLFDSADWRTDTRFRALPERVAKGDRIDFGKGLFAEVIDLSAISQRLIQIRFDEKSESPWARLYQLGEPIQYAHLHSKLDLWSFQTVYASRPWSVEMPSAGRPLHWRLLQELRSRGIEIEALTHAAGLSSTGDRALDSLLPLSEHYEVPASTAFAIERALREKRRIIAVGTSVVRALEGSAVVNDGKVMAGSGLTDLKISADSRLQIVNGLLSGIHVPGESHHHLLQAFASRALLESAHRAAQHGGFMTHEFGDSCLLMRDSP